MCAVPGREPRRAAVPASLLQAGNFGGGTGPSDGWGRAWYSNLMQRADLCRMLPVPVFSGLLRFTAPGRRNSRARPHAH